MLEVLHEQTFSWLSDDGLGCDLKPSTAENQPGARRVDDRRVISGIIHMLKCGVALGGCCPAEIQRPSTNGLRSLEPIGAGAGFWRRILSRPDGKEWAGLRRRPRSTQLHQGHRCAGWGKGGVKAMSIGRLARRVATTKIHALRRHSSAGPLRLILTPAAIHVGCEGRLIKLIGGDTARL